jgi:hypothetical protein
MNRKMHYRKLGIMMAGALLLALQAPAQVQIGDDVSLNLNGTVSTGYSGAYTDQGSAGHGITFGGNANLTGSYYSPSFLSFSVAPFYNQSRNNSSFQSITDSTGVTASAGIFSGSHFPGYVNYSKVYNGEGNYGIPGVASYKTNGDTQTFGVGWAANLPDLPSLSVGYQQGSSDYSVYGASSDNFSNYHSIFANTSYMVGGFHLNGGFHYTSVDSKFPQIVVDLPSQESNSQTTTYSANMNRALPMNGSTWASFTRSNYAFQVAGASDALTSDVVTGGIALRPTDKLGVQFNADYDDNLAGILYQPIFTAGGTVQTAIPGETTRAWGMFGQVQYKLLTGLYVAGNVSHRQQFYAGTNFNSTSYGGSASYARHLIGGQLSATLNVTESNLGQSGESMLGLLSSVTYLRRIGTWDVSGSFNYSQNVQTFLIAYTTSGYSYSATVSHKFRKVYWNAAASGSKSLLTNVQGSNSYSQGYSTGITCRWIGVSAGYSKSSGYGLYTPNGITPLPPGTPPPIIPTYTVFYGGTTYAIGAGSTPIRGLTINGNYARSTSNTLNATLTSNNITTQGNIFIQYLFRKVYFTAGYSRLLQGFSETGLPPSMVASYYAGVSRWFNFF